MPPDMPPAFRAAPTTDPAMSAYPLLPATGSVSQAAGLLALILYYVMPANLLVLLGIPYNVPGGALPFKFHPGSYLIALAFVATMVRRDPMGQFVALSRQFPALAGYALMLIGIMVYTTIRFGTGGVGFFIDTLFIPSLLVALLYLSPDTYRQRLFYWILGLTLVNAMLGIVESATQWRLLPYMIGDEEVVEDFFRSAALTSHPLESAQRTVPVLFACLILPVGWRIPCLLVLFLSLFAFGSRGAFGAALLFMSTWAGYAAFRAMVASRLDIRWLIWASLLLPLVLAAGGYSAWKLDLGARIFEKLFWDDSAASRLESVQLLDELTLGQFLFGAGTDGLAQLIDAKGGYFNIENFWVVLLIQLGIFAFVPFALGLIGLMVSVARKGPTPVRLAAFVYLLLASSNDALSHKSPNLSLLLATLIGATAVARTHQNQEPIHPGQHELYRNHLRRLRQPVREPMSRP